MKKALACLALVGCVSSGLVVDNGGSQKAHYTANPKPETTYGLTIFVFLDDAFSPTQKEAITEGVREWNYSLNGYETLMLVPGIDGRLDQIADANQGIIVEDDGPGSEADAVMEPGVLAVTQMGYRDNGIVHMMPHRIGTRDFKAVFMHELAHALGSDHVPFKGSLLYFSYSEGSHCIDLDTVRAVASLHAWDPNRMNWCSQ